MHFFRENNTGTIYLKIKMIRKPYFTHSGGFFRGREEHWVNVSEEMQHCSYCSFWLKRRILYWHVWRICRHFFFSTKSWYIPRLGTFANCDPTAPEYLSRICGIFFFPFSFIKNWEKHLWRMLLRPILLSLEPSHCLSTASFDILSHFPRSGSRGGGCSQLGSPFWSNSLAAGTMFGEN